MDKIVVFSIIITPVPHERKYSSRDPRFRRDDRGRDIADAIEMARRLHWNLFTFR